MPKRPMISIVDDDLSARDATLDLIRALGFTAKAFQCADDFLSSDSIGKTSCLISDMRMPGMSGLELYNHLVAMGNPIPTILVTAFPNDRDQARALQVGILCYLSKPFSEAELLENIHLALKNPKV